MPFTFDTISGAAAALILVLGLIHVAGRGIKAFGVHRMSRPAGDGRLMLQGSLSLDQARRLHIIRCDGRDLLLLTGGAADVVVGWTGQSSVAQGPSGS